MIVKRIWPLKIMKNVVSPLCSFYQRKRNKMLFQNNLRHTDVFLVGHPKSGNTWLAYMLAIVLYRDFEYRINLANLREFIPYIHGSDSSIAKFVHLSNPRVFRNEWPVYPDLYPKTLYLVRDPRAVLVSYFHHYRTVTGDDQTSLEDFVEEYLTYGCIRKFEPKLVRWDKQVLDWIERTKLQPVLIVKYEDVVGDRRKVLESVLKFIGGQYGEKQLELAVERGSFEAMRAIEEKYGAESHPGEIGRRGRFVRKGKINGWRQELTSNLAQRIIFEFAEAMNILGYL